MNLHEHADRLGLPQVTAESAEKSLVAAQAKKADLSLARLMLRAGRLTTEARAFVERYLAERT